MEFWDSIKVDIHKIEDWYSRLSTMQKSFIGGNVLYMLPSIEEKIFPEDSEVHFFKMLHLNGYDFGWKNAWVFIIAIYQAIEIFLLDYPENFDDYLDWYNNKKKHYSFTEKYFKSEGIVSPDATRSEVMKAEFDEMLFAKESWTATKDKLVLGKHPY